jgi:hypothetical protein
MTEKVKPTSAVQRTLDAIPSAASPADVLAIAGCIALAGVMRMPAEQRASEMATFIELLMAGVRQSEGATRCH